MNRIVNKIIAIWLVLALALSPSAPLFAQSSPDTRSPVIELEALAESQADSAQVFTAQVADDRVLLDVILYHRRAGQQPFAKLIMKQIGDSGFFTASVATEPDDLRAIEYYVQARDEGGNRTVEGYAFDPYIRAIIPNEELITSTVTTPETTSTSAAAGSSTSKIRWWHVALGVLAAGAVAAAVSGSGSDGDDGSVPLTVTLTGL